jgi:hypothetical protein
MEESVSGFKERGGWARIVEHGERVSRALREAGAEGRYSEAFSEWEEWRPKADEEIDEEVSEKTAEQASISEGEGERAGKDAEDDLKTAGERLTESYEKLEAEDTEGALSEWSESISYVARAADSASRKALRKVEGTVYRNVMTQIAPYYFDNELVSANVQKSSRGERPIFVFEINVNDDRLKAEVSDRLAEYEQRIDRWHVGARKQVETVRAAEGVEPTSREIEANSSVPADERVEEVIEPALDPPSVIEGEHPEKEVPPALATEAADGDDAADEVNESDTGE